MDYRALYRRIASLALALVSTFALPLQAQTEPRGQPNETATLPGLPAIGLWMQTRAGKVADWLGEPHQGKKLIEPINVIIVDPFASTQADAVKRLQAACERAELETREGHSGGYEAIIGTEPAPQFPPGTEDSFSDAPFTLSNNHGRIFGPMPWMGVFVFTAAFSRESVDLVSKVKHRYESFDRARDAFTQRMSAKTNYRISSFAYLGNSFPADGALTTGDHDGMAVLLTAVR